MSPASETERKYEGRPGRAMPKLDGLPRVAATSGPRQQVLQADYYDTDDLRLIRNGITLRRRRGGNDAGWHLKLPLGGGTRREIRRPLGRAGQSVPEELARLVLVYTRGRELRPVAKINTRRQVLTLVDAAGASLAEIATDDVSAQSLGAETEISAWNEVEVELTGGDRGLLRDADAWLRRAGLRPSARTAKLARALAGPLAERERRAAGNGRRNQPPAGSAGAVVLAYLRQQVARLKSLDPLVRGGEPDSVHQMRVTARRLRSTLQSFGQVIPRSRTTELIAGLKWLGVVLGEARDAEVLASRLDRNLRETPSELVLGPVLARVQGHFAPVHAAAREAALAALDSERYFALLDALGELLDSPPLTAAAAGPVRRVLPAQARHAYRRTARRMRRAQHAQPGRADVAYHEARKAAKRARYAGEAVSPALGKRARQFTKQMKRVQTVLGDHQDAVVARGVDRELGVSAHLAGENAFSYGLLYERETERADRLKKKANRVWAHRARPHFRHWVS
jgi:CHAD domain-containing protein